jgi:hypothetical protein
VYDAVPGFGRATQRELSDLQFAAVIPARKAICPALLTADESNGEEYIRLKTSPGSPPGTGSPERASSCKAPMCPPQRPWRLASVTPGPASPAPNATCEPAPKANGWNV